MRKNKLLFKLFVFLILSISSHGQFKKKPYLQNETDSTITVMWESYNSLPCSLTFYTDQFNEESKICSSKDGIFEEQINHNPKDTIQFYHIKFLNSTLDTVFFSSDTFRIKYNYSNFVKFGFISDPHPASSVPEAQVRTYDIMVQNFKNMEKNNVDFFVIGGDLVDRGDAIGANFFDQWSNLLNKLSYLGSRICYWPVIGNHDSDNDPTFQSYKKYHSLPNNEEYYSFTKGPFHIISLKFKDYQKGTPMNAWLESDLKAAARDDKIKYIFVAMHYTYYSSGYFNKFPDIRTDLVPLFEKYGVCAVLSGHDHHYERSFPIKDDKIDSTGITYFVSGGGGAYMLDTKPPQWHTAAISPQRDFHHSLIIENIENNDKEFCKIRCIPVDSIWQSPYDVTIIKSRKDFKLKSEKPLMVNSSLSEGEIPKVIFKWTRLAYADNYLLQVALDSNFNRLVYTDSMLVDTTCSVDFSKYDGEKLYLRVSGINQFCNSEYSDLSWFVSPLNPPTEINCNIEKNQKLVKWKDNSNNETGYVVQRKLLRESWSDIDVVKNGNNSYIDTTSSDLFSYYRVYAYNEFTTSNFSNEVYAEYPLGVDNFDFSYSFSGNVITLKIRDIYNDIGNSFFIVRKYNGQIKEINNLISINNVFTVNDTLKQLAPKNFLCYTLMSKNSNGSYISSRPLSVNLGSFDNSFYLSDNYPNPFNSSTRINFYLPEECNLTIKLYNIIGREVKEIVNENRNSGFYNILVDLKDLSSGVYFFNLKAESRLNTYLQTKKFVLLK